MTQVRWLGRVVACMLTTIIVVAGMSEALAARLTLKDGRTIDGDFARLSSMTENPNSQNAAANGVPTIVLVDDNLRRTFVAQRRVEAVGTGPVTEPEEKFVFRQPVPRTGAPVGAVGPLVDVAHFDEFGRRTVKMLTGQGVVPIIQGITELTPHWTKVEALQMEGKAFKWDMRIATSSIPPADLEKILAKLTDPKKLEARLRVVRFYQQAERFKDAEDKLKLVVRDFPENKDQFGPIVIRLRQSYARRIQAEIQTRKAAGQHGLVLAMLKNFPTEDVAGETLQWVRQSLDEYQALFDRGNLLLKRLDADLAKIKDSAAKAPLAAFREELKWEFNTNTIDRLSAYELFMDDPALQTESKVALAVSGWLVGANNAVQKLPVAISMFDVRNKLREYLTETLKLKHEEIIEHLRGQEGGTPAIVAQLLAQMKPPLPMGEALKGKPGLYQLEVDVLPGEPTTNYLVQLPPEYDPHRAYPTVVTLNGAGSTPEQQIEWWAGAQAPDGSRLGQATRNGYIVIAPAWAKTQQKNYNYSIEEHVAVLNSLRDACRRFAIDTDRVFLSGHSMGGDAAWDIGLAHPDLWAGMIPIAAAVDKYVAMYWENAAYVPFYLVSGQLDGEHSSRNARDLDRYFKHGYNATVVDFQGRGHEHFSDEILRLFDWMGRYKRNFFPKEFTCRSMRTWDNFFWWIDLENLPERSIVDPNNWPPPRGTLAAPVEAEINEKNGINVKTGAAGVTVWLSPEIVNFEQPIRITVKGSRLKTNDPSIEPNLKVLLEDARARG